jgi:hypothetical protein
MQLHADRSDGPEHSGAANVAEFSRERPAIHKIGHFDEVVKGFWPLVREKNGYWCSSLPPFEC